MENLPPPYPSRKNGWILPFKNKILMLRSKGYPFYQIAEILQPEAQKQGRKVSASIVSYWVTTWRQQDRRFWWKRSVFYLDWWLAGRLPKPPRNWKKWLGFSGNTHYFETLGEPSDGLGWVRFFKKTRKKRLTEKPPPRTRKFVVRGSLFFK